MKKTDSECVINARNKINEYILILEKEVCFTTDCIHAIKSMEAALNEGQAIIHEPFVTTAYLALHNEIIITLSKIFEETRTPEGVKPISVLSLKNLLFKNDHCIQEPWQLEKYTEYCQKYKITDMIHFLDPDIRFTSINESIKQLNKNLEEHEKAIAAVKERRDTIFAHYDIKYRNEDKLKILLKKYPLNTTEIEQLLKIAHQFLYCVSVAIGRTPMNECSLF